LFDGLLNYISCTTEDIIQTANFLQESCSEAKLTLDKLKKRNLLNRELDTNRPKDNNIPRKEQSLLGKRSNPFIEIDKETVLQPDLELDDNLEITISQAQRIIEEESAESIDLESNDDSAYTEEYEADLSTSVGTPKPLPKTYADKGTQTTPIIPANFSQNELNFLGPFNHTPIFNFAPNNNTIPEQNFNENDNENDLLVEKVPDPIQPSNQMVFIQPVYLIQPIQIINYLPVPSQIQMDCSPAEAKETHKTQEM